MDITNSIGGLGVLGVRALHLSGRETLLHIKNSNLIISALGSSPETPLFSKKERPLLIFNNHQPIYSYLTESLFR